MAEKKSVIKEGYFVELEFVGKIKDGGIFDSNIANELRKINPKIKKEQMKQQQKIFCIGQKMLLENLENKLIGKEIPGNYKIELTAEQGFGLRDSKLIKILPTRVFIEKNIQPQPGMIFALDNFLVKILSVSGGRVTADFNNPLAGKDLVYEIKIIRKVTEEKEKVGALILYFLKKKIDFEIKEKKIILKEKNPYIKFVAPKFKEILDKELVEEQENKNNIEKQ